MLRAVVAGAGLMGRWHADAAQRAGACLVGVVDSNLSRARALTPSGATAFASLEEALGQRPDVVHVCTPGDTHLALCRAALEAGSHVIVEKPATETASEAAQLQALADQCGRRVVPVHQFVFQPGVQQILAARDRLGPLRHVEFAACSAGADRHPGTDRDQIAAEISPHAFSLARALLGVPVGALAWRLARAAAGEWRFTATTEAGCCLSNLISLSARPTLATWRVLAERGSASADLFHGFATFEPGTASRSYKLGRPVAVGLKSVAAASGNLTRRLVRNEPAYPGLRELCAQTYAAIAGAAGPFRADELVDVAEARARLVWK